METNQEALAIARGLLALILDRVATADPVEPPSALAKQLHTQKEYKEWNRVNEKAATLYNVCRSRWDRVPQQNKQAVLDIICFHLLSVDAVMESGFYLMGEELCIENQLAAGNGEEEVGDIAKIFEREERDELSCLKTLSAFEVCFSCIDKWRSRFNSTALSSSPWLESVQTKLWLKLNSLVKVLANSRIKFANELVHKMHLVLQRIYKREGHLESLFAFYSVGERNQNVYLCQLCLQAIKRLAIEFNDHYSLIDACHLEPQDMPLLRQTCEKDGEFAKSVNVYLLEQKRYSDLLFDLPQSVEQAVDLVKPSNAKELLWLCAMANKDHIKAAQVLREGNTKRQKGYDNLAFLCQFVG